MGLRENLLTNLVSQLALRDAIIREPGTQIRDTVVLIRSKRLAA